MRWKFSLSAAIAIIFVLAFGVSEVAAQSKDYSIDNIDITIDVADDTTFTVREEITYTLNDEFNGLRRDITIEDYKARARCDADNTSQCGGFSLIDIENFAVIDEQGNSDTRVRFYNINENEEDRYRVEYKFPDAPVRFNGDEFTFVVEYQIWGGMGIFEEEDYALFYWDPIFPDRDVPVEKATVTINYPGEVSTSARDFEILNSGITSFEADVENRGNTVEIDFDEIPPLSNITVIHRLPLEQYILPAELNLRTNESLELMEFDDREFALPNSTISGLPPGEYSMTFHPGDNFLSATRDISLEENEVKIVDLEFQRSPQGIAILIAQIIGNILCCLTIFVIPGILYIIWRRWGKDPSPSKQVVTPEYQVPDNIRPYLLGSLKDEKVDNVDITSTIIDLAYRGYIKIKEEKQKGKFGSSTDYTLTKLKEVEESGFEQDLMKDIFGSSKNRKLSDLKTTFYAYLPELRQKVYDEMIERDYFKEDPKATRAKWLGIAVSIGIVALIVGLGMAGLGIILAIPAVLILGLGLLLLSFVMPKKTEIGAEMLRRIKGFKMYLETAEKHRVQNLTPEIFEKFLPYAIVFGVEKAWAQKFEGIYEGTPDWYVGSDMSTFNALVLANAMSDFNNSAQTAVTSTPSSEGGSGGGGWSGGGGFSGGFSGGGGGGGGGGAF